MWVLPTITFWSSLGLLGYTYLGYPVIIHALARIRNRKSRKVAIEPRVSVVMPVRNEQQGLKAKLENLLSLDYPREKLEFIVVSDGSTDATVDICKGYEDRGVQLIALDRPMGKACALNAGVAAARGEIVLFCDVRQEIEPGALRALVSHFGDPAVGAVSGELLMSSNRGPGIYWFYDKFIRFAEGRFDSVVGATGALYAIRRHLFLPLPEACLLDDVYTPMQIVMQGHRVLFEPSARCSDMEASISGEFSRKSRTLAGNFQLLKQLPNVLNPFKNRIFFQFVSHKVLRLVCPAALASLLASNFMLVLTFAPGWPLYVLVLVGQLGFYGLALRSLLGEGPNGRLSTLSQTFVVLNAAAVEGLRRYLRGDFSWR